MSELAKNLRRASALVKLAACEVQAAEDEEVIAREQPEREPKCDDCGRWEGYVWLASPETWRAVMGDTTDGRLCPNCFRNRASSAKISTHLVLAGEAEYHAWLAAGGVVATAGERPEKVSDPEVCVMCGTTAELDSGDCAFCAGHEQAEAKAVGKLPKQFVSDRDLLRALVDRGLVVLGHEGLYVNYDAIRAAINREET